MKFSKATITAAITAAVAISANCAPLTVDDYCSPKLTAPKGIKEMTPLADGLRFACVSDDGRSIEVYSYKSGEKTGTLFSLDGVKGDVRINSFDGYQLSANEKKILLWTNTQGVYRYSFTAQYYVYDILRSTLKPVSDAGAQRGATISHDGRMVAYMRDNNLFISNLDYGSDRAITEDGEINKIIYGIPDWAYEEEFGILNSIRWSPDDNTLAYIRWDESKVPVYEFDNYKSFCEENPLSEPYPKPYSYKYPLAGYPNSIVSVYAYNVDNKVAKKLDLPITDQTYVPSLEFDAKGDNLMVILLNRDQNHLELYKANPGSTLSKLIYQDRSEAWLSPKAYQMVRYYDNSFVIGSERTGYRHLYEYDYNGNLRRNLTSGDWNVTEYYGMDTKSGVHYLQTTQRGPINRNIASVDSKGNIKMLNPVDGTESAEFSKNFAYFVRKYSSVSVPPQYTICDNKGKLQKNLELNETYASKYASAPKMEFLKVPNAEGEEMDAYIIRPADFDASKSYPLMMYQYNGPDSQLVLNSWKMDGTYYIASQGYVVGCVDGRGTGNRSRKWANCVYMNLGKYETADQIAGANYFASLPYVDANRLSCFGWSYGGYMTLMELAAENCPFKAGVAMAPVTDWKFYDSIYTERYMRTPQQNEAGYAAASAIDKSADVDTRLLIMSGTNDDNVHFYNTLMYASKLNSEGKVFDMMAYAGFEHSLRMCNARTQLYKKVVDFLNTNVK